MFEVREDLTIENILNLVSEYQIFRNYCPNFIEVNKPFISDTRKETKPSANIIYSNGRLWYKDFGSGEKAKDCFTYMMDKYNLTFREALGVVNNDFNLGLKKDNTLIPSLNYFGFPDKDTKTYQNKGTKIIRVKVRHWDEFDKIFWGKYHIKIESLNKFYVQPIEWFSVNEHRIRVNKYVYSYYLGKEDGILRYKIYNKYDTKYKWITNCKESTFQGMDQLPLHGDTLVITKSLKDVICLFQYGINAVAPQSENILNEEVVNRLKRRFDNILLLFDNDIPGIEASAKNAKKYGFREIFIPIESECKDISDYLKKYGVLETSKLLKQLI